VDDNVIELDRAASVTAPGRTDLLRAGDYITLDDFGVLYYFTVISVDGLFIQVDKAATQTKSNLPIYFGYKTPLRLADSAIEDGYGKIINQATNDINTFDRRVRGKWAVVGMNFKGEDQIYINNIVSTYTRSFS
jgi:hypothetical protein